MFLLTIVSQMDITIECSVIVFVARSSDVWCPIEVDFEVAGYQGPDSDIEFAFLVK